MAVYPPYPSFSLQSYTFFPSLPLHFPFFFLPLPSKTTHMKQNSTITIPEGLHQVLLHACCAPCSSAIVEWMLQHDIQPTIFYFNPNIYPREEYEIRKNESKRHADSLNIPWLDGDYDHQSWLQQIRGLEHEPERGARCLQCFRIRLLATALQAQALHISHFATTLASSRWKNLNQINQAGLEAQQLVASTPSILPLPCAPSSSPCAPSPSATPSSASPSSASRSSASRSSVMSVAALPQHPSPLFWPQNWRKAGLQDRRNQLLRQYSFYNQLYCGCEFSLRSTSPSSLPTPSAPSLSSTPSTPT